LSNIYRPFEVLLLLLLLLPGRHDPAVPRPKRMLSDKGSNVLVRHLAFTYAAQCCA
jgi:hypothetical protein